MANPTTNFGWVMPTSTDLVTDLPADFAVFGQAVDTSMADLKGGTTGQVLAKASNTDMDFVWSTDATGMTNPMTTTGDTIYSSSGSTPARRAIGTTGQVLTVAGGIPTWAAPAAATQNFTQIGSTTTLTGASSFTISGISGINTLYIQAFNVASSSASGFQWFFRPNNNSTGANYQYNGLRFLTSTTYNRGNIVSENSNGTSMIQMGSGGTTESGHGSVTMMGCAGTGVKVFSTVGGKDAAQDQYLFAQQGYYIDSNPITSVTILTGGGSNFTGGSFRIFGA